MLPRILEKRRSLFYLCVLSTILLLLSCFFLWRTSNDSLIPQSVLMLMFVNNTSSGLSTGNNTNSSQLTNHFRKIYPTVLDDRQTLATKNSPCSKDEMSAKSRRLCDPARALLRVYMYDLPPMFHFGLLNWKGKAQQLWPDISTMSQIPRYPGGLNLQHSVEYWLTLDLLASNSGVVRPCTAIRVMNSSSADVIFVPFFSSVSYNRHSKLHGKEKVSRNNFLQDELVNFLMSQEEWKRSGGKDHLIVAHHPNSMLNARRKLGSAMFVLADFGRYSANVANIKKDVIAPYRHVVSSIGCESPPFTGRPILMYFQGAIYRKDVSPLLLVYAFRT
uniref:Xyloglucan galactosyltransferase KATAMARI1 n=1 Tax=Anthurium amnicola TaxID=1678845 RepID=A0A1D1YIE8_9ARAE